MTELFPFGIADSAVAEAVALMQSAKQDAYPEELRRKIGAGVTKGWGTRKTKSFVDSTGPGWTVDLSDLFDGEMLYAIIRSIGGGKRQVVSILEADDTELLHQPQPLVEPPHNLTGPMTGSLAQLPVSVVAEPVLVIVRNEEAETVRRTDLNEIKNVVSALIQAGTNPDQIEIWSTLRKPKIQIAFE